MTAAARFVGQRVARHEDPRFLTGRAQYVDDIKLPTMLHAAFARSHVAKGRIVTLDLDEARATPGVIAVFGRADLEAFLHDHRVDDEPPGQERPYRLLADDVVSFVGEAVAMVIAESRYLAEDGVDAILLEIEPDEPIIDPLSARDPDAPRVHAELESNLYSSIPAGNAPDVDAVIAAAPFQLTETFRQHRYLTVPMETRGIIAAWDPRREELEVWISTQGPHGVRAQMARALGVDDAQVRVRMPDVGGSFGLKMHPSEEELAVVLATRCLGRPIKWIQDRRENLMADEHPREDQATVTMATEADGTLVAAKYDFVESAGSFPSPGGSAAVFTTMLAPGPYRLSHCAASAESVFTNTSGRGAYRGPWMIETVVRELMIDRVAANLGIDPLEMRRRNVIHENELPYLMASGLPYDHISLEATLEQAAEQIGYAELREQQRAWRAEGRLVGIGMSLFAEPTSMAFGWMSTDGANVRIGTNGKVDVAHSGASHGQSLETTVGQLVADELGVDFSQVRVIQGDTDATPLGPGTGGSRSAVILGGAVRLATRELRSRVVDIVAHALEAAPDDIEIVDGWAHVVGSPSEGMTMREVATLAYTSPGSLPPGAPLGLEAQARYTPESFCTWSNACHMCLVEVDPDTGAVEILRYVVSEDCGVMINPNVVEGQIAGGVVQGIGGVLYEHLPYDADGNPLATTFVDYLLPTTTEVPQIEYGHIETPEPTNPGGHKGMGEGGAIGSPPALVNAVADALGHLGVVIRSQPLGPADVIALIETAK